MSSKSGLDIMSLPDIFQSIANAGQTGTLKVQSSQGEKYLCFRAGNIQQVYSSERPSILAEGLRRHPELDEESYEELCRRQRQTGESLASLLLAEEEGRDLVVAVCQFQIIEEVCELFTWSDPHCEFTEYNDKEPQMFFDPQLLELPIDMNGNAVLLEAARRYDEWKPILETLPSKKDIPYQLGAGLPEDCPPEQVAVLTAVDGFLDIEEILAEVRLSPFAAMKSLAELAQGKYIALKNGAALLQMANMDIFREDKQKCLKLYERAEELGQKGTEITMWLAHSYEVMGMKDKSAKQYRQLGYSCLHTGLYPGAARAFEMVVQLVPNDLVSQERVISLFARMNRLEEYAEKITHYARWLAMAGDRERAILVLEEATEKYPHNVDNLDLLASLYRETGDQLAAIQIYEVLANLQQNRQDFEGTINTFHKIILINRDHLPARKTIALILDQLGRHTEALEHYRAMGKMICATEEIQSAELADYLVFASTKIVERYPEDLTARQWLAEAYMGQKKNEEAIRVLEELLPKLDRQQHLVILVETLKRLVKLQPKNLEERRQLADAYLKIKREREAVQEYFSLGLAAAEVGKIDEALDAFDRLLSFEPSNFATRLKKSDILVQQDKKGAAMEELVLTGYLSMGSDKLWQAVKAFRQVLSLDKEGHLVCYFELGKLYDKLGKPDEAILAYKKHVQKSIKANNFGDALESCERILQLSPDTEWAKSAKAKILETIGSIALSTGKVAS